MKEKQWTKRQRAVIDSRDEDLLVAAAAGSGKTAVLVEHVIRRILSKEDPVDMDEIVVVTFTRAAAAEMRERILAAIEAEREKRPEDADLIRQATLVHNAMITTIDSFCGYVVRNHFHEIDLDPDYRIADESELKLMARSVMDAFMEEEYQTAQSAAKEGGVPVFLSFVDAYGRGGTDEAVTEMILRLYEKAQSHAWPRKWLRDSIGAYQDTSAEKIADSKWFFDWMEEMRAQVAELAEETEELLALAVAEGGPACYAAGLEADLALYNGLLASDGAKQLYLGISQAAFGPIGRKPRNYEGDADLLEEVKERRNALKARMLKLRDGFCARPLSDVAAQMERLRPMAEELVRLTEGFMDAFEARKRRKNVVDFNDIEHFALAILRDEETNEPRPAAREFMRQYREIIIDEYQDSNDIQEEILTSISRESIGGHNMFMVGDVKQSIYSFRQARPSIFTGKYKRYHEGEEGCRAIDLHENFRSRSEVLDFVNAVFYPLMKKDLGEITYDDEAALQPGGIAFPQKGDDFATEIWIGEADREWMEMQGENKIRWEAELIAGRIKKMQQDGFCVTDPESGTLRPMKLSDVVILMRSPNRPAGQMVEALKECGIAAYAENRTGYFDTVEVETVLHFLRLLDNPKQDIPMAAVLHSPIFGFETEELALLKAEEQDGLPESLQKKKEDFWEVYRKLRKKAAELPIHQLLEELLEETGYLHYVSALPGGESRRMNLEKLVDLAFHFEQTSLKGLFHFVRYIEECQKYEVDMGEAGRAGGHEDAVAILSIHKSKGLEYPVCFLAGACRKFRKRELYETMITDPDLGVGLQLIDPAARTKEETLYQKIIASRAEKELLGEEMRILYVALTRAKEKLILTGVMENAQEAIDRWQQGARMRYLDRAGAGCYMEWVIRALSAGKTAYPVTIIRPEDILLGEAVRRIGGRERRAYLEEAAASVQEDALLRLKEDFAYRYPYEDAARRKNKYSVSEIKHAQMERTWREDDAQQPDFLREEKEKTVPLFLSDEERERTNPGALYGTAMHRFLECFDFAAMDEETPEKQRERMLRAGRLHEDENRRLAMDKIARFLKTPLARRMNAAAQRGELYVEQPFVMELQREEAQGVLVQGIVDAFFVEDGKIVLLDYKTDRVGEAGELIRRYDVQLRLYADALAGAMALPVAEMLIYSFCLDETIAL